MLFTLKKTSQREHLKTDKSKIIYIKGVRSKMMNKKTILLIILVIFIAGMIMSPATATHTFKDKGYKYTMKDKLLKKMKKIAKKNKRAYTTVTATKLTTYDTMEKLKIGKTYKDKYGKKEKVLKVLKTYTGNIYGGWGFKYQMKKYSPMECCVSYSHGKYHYSAEII